MTVSNITGLPADVKRTLDNQNRSSQQTRQEAKAPGGATLPKDTISAGLAPALDLNAAILQTRAQNKEAAKASLSDDDVEQLENAEATPQEQVQAQAHASLRAQTARLPANILQLLVE